MLVSNENISSGARNLSSWAKEFISINNLKASELKFSKEFCSLSKKQKDAVRYQLKTTSKNSSPKLNKTRPQNPPKKTQIKNFSLQSKIKFAVALWIVFFLMKDLMKFYSLKGASEFEAFQMAFLVEGSIILCCLSQRRILKICAYSLFVYNGFIFSSLVIMERQSREARNIAKAEQRKDQLLREGELKEEIKSLRKEKLQLQFKMDGMIKDRWISRGQQIYLPLIKGVENRQMEAKKTLNELRAWKFGSTSKGKLSKPSKEGFLSIILLIFVRLVLQFVAFQFFHGISWSNRGMI